MTKMLKLGDLPQDNQIALNTAKLEYIQKPDCCDEGESDQMLTIETHNGGTDHNDTFYVLSTQRWAFDSPQDLIMILNDIIKRLT